MLKLRKRKAYIAIFLKSVRFAGIDTLERKMWLCGLWKNGLIVVEDWENTDWPNQMDECNIWKQTRSLETANPRLLLLIQIVPRPSDQSASCIIGRVRNFRQDESIPTLRILPKKEALDLVAQGFLIFMTRPTKCFFQTCSNDGVIILLRRFYCVSHAVTSSTVHQLIKRICRPNRRKSELLPRRVREWAFPIVWFLRQVASRR